MRVLKRPPWSKFYVEWQLAVKQNDVLSEYDDSLAQELERGQGGSASYFWKCCTDYFDSPRYFSNFNLN